MNNYNRAFVAISSLRPLRTTIIRDCMQQRTAALEQMRCHRNRNIWVAIRGKKSKYNNNSETSFGKFWRSYRSGDAETRTMVRQVTVMPSSLGVTQSCLAREQVRATTDLRLVLSAAYYHGLCIPMEGIESRTEWQW
jgi:hypothetical protein